jgi:translation elongation factor Ts
VVVIENGDEELAKDIAMHVAASQPEYIQISDIPEDVIDEERKILTKQVEDEGKPADIIPKIVDGKLNKQFNSITLMGQEFIKDPDLTVAKLLEKSGSSVVSFTRYEVGEGVEVEEVNFADEVKAQVDAVN